MKLKNLNEAVKAEKGFSLYITVSNNLLNY